jgi:hypothetical protein
MPSKGTIVHRGPGTLTVKGVGIEALTPFDPIKVNPSVRKSVSIRGRGRFSESIVGRGLETLVITATSAPAPRIPKIDPLAASRNTPALPRRQYIPTVGSVPTE